MPHELEGLITRADIVELAEKEQLILENEERISVLEAMRSIDVQACPGSGKTTLIAAKLILLAKKWSHRHQGVCVLSHTNVAKDEIVERIKNSKVAEAQRLLSYPHFIGTIQEFVGKHLAFPYLRSKGTKINIVNTDECVRLIHTRIGPRTRSYIDRKSQHSNVLYDFDISYEAGRIKFNVPTFPNGSDSPSYRDLLSVRKSLIEEGCFFYHDVFVFSQEALHQNETLRTAIQNRFLCVFIDEMQDTQSYQDELLADIFLTGDDSLALQRFGDPDQAIFHGVGDEKPNESFNGKPREEMDYVINKSHRFDHSIADKISSLSLNQVPLETELQDAALEERSSLHASGGPFEHSVIVFTNETRGQVIDKFTQIVSDQFSNGALQSDNFTVKVVGAVGNEIDPDKDQLKIGHYWGAYDKTKSKSSFTERTFIEAVRYCRQRSYPDWSHSYKFISDCILRFLRLADVWDDNGCYYSATTLRGKLVQEDSWYALRQGVFFVLRDDVCLSEEVWREFCTLLSEVFGIKNIVGEAEAYLRFEPEQVEEIPAEVEQEAEDLLKGGKGNRILHRSGFEVQLSTIHGVKGETHDATLILETKNHVFDLGTMLPYLTGELPSAERENADLPVKPNSRRAFKPNKVFMRQLYVAASRPRHLLCLALHADRMTREHETALREKGWNIERL